MSTNDVKQGHSKELEEKLLDFFGKGGTFKDLKNMSDDAMEAIYSVAYSLYQSAKYEEAQKVFQFLCFYDHFNKKYFMGLAACQQMLKNYTSAIEVFTFATILDANDPRPMVYIGDCHLSLDDKGKAQKAYETAIHWAGNKPDYAEEKQRAQRMLENIAA